MGAARLPFVELCAHQLAEFAFNHAIVFVGVFNHSAADGDVLVERFVGGVDHDAGEPVIDTFLAEFVGVAVVQMHGDGDVRKADGRVDKFLEVDGIRILPGALGDLEHDRGLFLLAGFNDGLEQLHVVHVECPQGILAFECSGKEIACVG
jgi:hypothetical protein